MGIFGWLSDLFGYEPGTGADVDDGFGATAADVQSGLDDNYVNPASGLPMVGGMGGVDVEGNPFGTDFSDSGLASSSSDMWADSGCGSSDW